MPRYPYPIFFVLENGYGRLTYWSQFLSLPLQHYSKVRCISPPLDFGLGHENCFVQWDLSRWDVNTDMLAWWGLQSFACAIPLRRRCKVTTSLPFSYTSEQLGYHLTYGSVINK
jgi:hypothetical protein